jgi:hypothetical protein
MKSSAARAASLLAWSAAKCTAGHGSAPLLPARRRRVHEVSPEKRAGPADHLHHIATMLELSESTPVRLKVKKNELLTGIV